MKKKSLLLIDGHALAYRYYFALERSGMKTADGRPIWAVFGFFKCMFDLLQETKVNPDLIAVTFDVARVTFRCEMYSEYKANRESMPADMHDQLDDIIEGLHAFNIPIYTKAGFEADDVIGTIAERAKNQDIKVMILTGDRDSFQLVDDEKDVTVIMPSKGEIISYDREKVFERMGVYPEQIVDLKGLAGDVSDNIPGIRGIGDKTASKLLSQYQTLEGIYEHVDEVSGKALKQKLIDGKEDALLSKNLATIRRDVDVDFDFKETCLELNNQQAVMDFFRKNSFYNFMKNSDRIFSHFKICDDEENTLSVSQNTENSENSKDESASEQLSLQLSSPEVVSENGQLGLFATEVKKMRGSYNIERILVDTKEKLDNLINILKTKSLISVDTETMGLNPMEDDIVGLSLAYNDQIIAKNGRVKFDETKDDVTYSYYIPLFHSYGEQVDFDYAVQSLASIFGDEKIAKTMQNAKFDLHVLQHHKMPVNGLIFDTMLASYIYDSSRKHGLKIQAAMYLSYIMTEFEQVAGKNLAFDEVNLEQAKDYACDDAFATLELTRHWQNTLNNKEIDLLYDVEVPTTIVLTDMEEVGVSIDRNYLKKLSDEIQQEINRVDNQIIMESGEYFNVNSPRQVKHILFDKMGLRVRGRKRASQSTNAKVLEDLAQDYPIAKYILEQRHLSKLKSTYIDVLPSLVSCRDNRIHTSFNQTITTTGRLSSSNPNLQNIPARSDWGTKIRGAFVPENPENIMLSADYSQIELRLLAHCSQDENLMQAFIDDVDVHTLTASKIFDVPEAAVTKEMRRKAKAVNFGIVYGQSKYGLASQLDITPTKADEFIIKYFQTYPSIQKYMLKTIDFARANGYVETIYGRKRWFDNLIYSTSTHERDAAERAAINAPLQGSAADLIKKAMVDLYNYIKQMNLNSKIVIQVHDELVLEVVQSERELVSELVKKAMEQGQPLTVPLKVDMAFGQNLMEM